MAIEAVGWAIGCGPGSRPTISAGQPHLSFRRGWRKLVTPATAKRRLLGVLYRELAPPFFRALSIQRATGREQRAPMQRCGSA